MNMIDAMGPEKFFKRLGQVERMLVEHGATYNLFDDPQELDRPWELDLIPLIISAREWLFIKAGLEQRARLHCAIYKDLYSNQSLVNEGLIPPELVYANPGFLRVCTGMESSWSGAPIVFSMDLFRTAQGEWRVAGRRAQTPIGPGYALENRVIMSQVLSRIFHQNRIKRLAPFFIKLDESLKEAALFNKDDPSIVTLTPGPSSKTYFEHAYLSRYLGYPMVESGDLTIRDNKVYMKTLGGLEQVDVLFRWTDDRDSDPLALRGDPALGVSGLIHAVRTGALVVVNPIGAGVTESPAFAGYLPGLCRHLLGEDLLLRDASSLWCGDPMSLEQALAAPENYIFAHCFGGSGPSAIDKMDVKKSDWDALVEKIHTSPYQYIAYEKTGVSTAPTLDNGNVAPWRALSRFFVSADRDSIKVMPGGLGRVGSDSLSLLLTGGEDALSKDIWVISDKPVEQVSLLDRMEKTLEIKRGGDLPSRIADNLLWLGRYIERAENQVRLYRSMFKKLSSETPYMEMPEIPVLLKMAADRGFLSADKVLGRENLNLFEMQDEILEAVFDPQRPASLIAALGHVHRTAKSVRDRLSLDSWRVVMRLEHTLKKSDAEQWLQVSETFDLMTELLISLSAFSGLAMESITRGLGWRFMDMGRRIDRADHIIGVIKSALVEPVADQKASLEALLEILDSAMTYRSRYRTSLQVPPALDLLIADEVNPRSLAFQLAALTEHVDSLPRGNERKFSSPEEKAALRSLTAVRLWDLNGLCEPDSSGRRNRLEEVLSSVEAGLNDFAMHVTQHYLSRIPTTQHFTSLYPEGKQ